MKKKLAILLAAVMVASMVPVTAFAKTKNYMKGSPQLVKKDEAFVTGSAPKLVIENEDGFVTGTNFYFDLNLTNAEWDDAAIGDNKIAPAATGKIVTTKNTNSSITVKVESTYVIPAKLELELLAKVTGDGDAQVTVVPVGMNNPISGGTYTFAIGSGGSTSTTIAKSVALSEGTVKIEPIIIRETTAGVIKGGASDEITLKLKPASKFQFANALVTGDIVDSYGACAIKPTAATLNAEKDTLTISTTGITTTKAAQIVLNNINIVSKSKANDGDIAEITIKGAGLTEQTLEVGTFTEYGYTFTVEDKDLPVFYSGRDDNKTLKVTFKEPVANSWSPNRKTTFTFPEGVKVQDVEVVKPGNVESAPGVDIATGNFIKDGNVVSLSGVSVKATKKAAMELKFKVSISPEFTGDITCTVGGSAVGEDTEVIVAKAQKPFVVEVTTSEVNIDYRNVKVNDIVIKENFAGALKDGTILTLQADSLSFEKGFKWDVTEGNLDIKDITIKGGKIEIAIKSESTKTPATLVISNLELYLNRSLPAGDYALNVVVNNDALAAPASPNKEAFFRNYSNVDTDPYFDIDEVEVAKAFVKVITAGRDQDDSTFTTQISVPIGAYEIKAGTKTVALDTPAYINEAGYTMMPLRGVVEALSGSAIISWDDASKTVTILFGTRVISMTIGTKSMIINGTSIAMTSAPVIVNSRTFLPLRDLGYALGLSENKINWDDTTKTATLN